MEITYGKPQVLFVLFSFILVYGIMIVIFNNSGWKELAAYYSYQQQKIKRKIGFQWANIEGVNFKSCVTIGGNAEGILISIPALMRNTAPDLFIPWSDIKIEKKRYWTFSVFELSFAKTPNIKIMLKQSMESFLQEFYGKPLP